MNANIVQRAIAAGLIKPPAQQTKKRIQNVPLAIGGKKNAYITTVQANEILGFSSPYSARRFLLNNGVQCYRLPNESCLRWNKCSVKRAAAAKMPTKRPPLKIWVTVNKAMQITGFSRTHLFKVAKLKGLDRYYAYTQGESGKKRKTCFFRIADITNLRQRQPKKH